MKCQKRIFPALAASALSFCVALPVYADITLFDNSWALLTVPADASSSTIESLFGDDLPIDGYGQNWTIFQFDTTQQDYVQPEVTDSLAQGDGFWIVQLTGSDVIIDLPNNLPEGSADNTLPCATPNGCFSSRLPASTANGLKYSLIGAPYSVSINVNDIRLTSSEDNCNSGFDLGESVQADYLFEDQWTYDSATGDYEVLSDIETLSPWQAFWVATPQQAAPVALFMLLPNPIGNS